MPKSLAFRSFALFLCAALVNIAVPGSLIITAGVPARQAIRAKIETAAKEGQALAKRRAISHTRALTSRELNSLQGRTAQCPYIAGASKWDPNVMGVDLLTGNYSMSATDLSFDGGYGIPVNITRSYSANDANEGPFGWGWSLSADVRTTAGGILKSTSAPVRSVPTIYKERAPQETDPNVSVQPTEAVTSTDASGQQETIQKDADGVLSPAAWDQNQSVTRYQSVVVGGSAYQVMSSQTLTTPDGTVYQYQAEGSYINGGTYPYSTPTATPTPANVLKCVSATDRNGNTTTYSYGTTLVQFSKIDGTTQEYPLVGVQMPNGHTITLVWGNGTTGPVNRVVQVYDNSQARIVNYSYTGGNLTSVKSPAGLVTTYGYSVPVNNMNSDVPVAVMSSITDPRGLTTSIVSFVGVSSVMPYNAAVEAVVTNMITTPDGAATTFNFQNVSTDISNPGNCLGDINYSNNYEPITAGENQSNPGYVGWCVRHFGGVTSPVASQTNDTVYVNGNLFETQESDYPTWRLRFDPCQTENYDIFSQNDVSSFHFEFDGTTDVSTLAAARLLVNSLYGQNITFTANNYNFLGKLLDSTVSEYLGGTYHNDGGTNPGNGSPSGTLLRTATTSYAYWDSTKYYQQKAVKDPGGRISYTDYYTSTDPNPGNRGQQYMVWDPKYGGTGINTQISPPSGTQTQDAWRYQVYATTGQNAAQFSYDSLGRPTTVLKLQAATIGSPSTYRYVTTQTSYSGATGSWGQATQVVEDYGGINRTTKNLGYTSWGQADDVVDGAGHEFQTSYDWDGKVKSVTEVGTGTIATYVYGTMGVSNGQPTSITDGLTNVTTAIAYQSTPGGGIGQPASVTETRNGSVDNVVSYVYDAIGDRSMATYRDGSNNLLAQWGYYDYWSVGLKGQFVFQTLCKLDGNGNRTPEEFHYNYDSDGRLTDASFAQTPSNNTPDANGYYDGHLAQYRARVHNEYDAGGRLYLTQNYWDTLNSGGTAYTSAAILAQSCDFEENTGLNRGVKLDSKYYTPTTPGQGGWTQSQEDTYSYDPKLDYLTGATYGDGLANASPTWSYDAAGNRNDTVADNLNRPTSIGGVACTSDILGNRLTMGSNTYGWDLLNRMTSYNSTSYAYRSDGMRIFKSNAAGSTSYRYDGQMGMEDIDYAANGSVSKVTDYGIGARGIDAMYVTQNGSTNSAYPIYDAHGNMLSTLTRQGSSSFATSSIRTFDAWGNIRIGAQTGDPKGRYCASLGHKQDDESGLTYMRGRYYEPTSGRFLSDDPEGDGTNWQIYCSGDPVNQSDYSGKFGENQTVNAILMWALATIIDQLERFGIEIPKGPSLMMKDLLKGALQTAAALEMASSFQSAAGLTMLLGMESGQPEIMGAAAGMYALAGVFTVVAMVYAYQTAMQIDIDYLDS